MPVTPSNQLFQNTGLANNPILSALMVMSQRQQDEKDRATAEEDRQLELKQANDAAKRQEELFKLQKQQFDNQVKGQQAALEQSQIANRVNSAKFQLETIPEAIRSGAITSDFFQNPYSSQRHYKDTSVVDPITQEEIPVTGDMIENIRQIDNEEHMRKIAPQLLRMQVDQRKAMRELASREAQAGFDRESREKIAKMRSDDVRAANASRIAAAKLRKEGGSVVDDHFSIGKIAAGGTKLTGKLSTDEVIWNNLTPSERAIFSGDGDISDYIKDPVERIKLEQAASKVGFKVPNFKSQEVKDYAVNKTSINSLYQVASEFNKLAPKVGEGPLSKFKAGIDADTPLIGLRAQNHPSVALYDQMKGRLTGLKEIVGETGVLTNEDIKRLEGMLPTYTDSTENRKKKLNDFIKFVQQREATYFATVPEAQRNLMFATHGISGFGGSSAPTSSKGPMPISKLKDLP